MELPDGFDAILHPPARLQIAAILANADTAEFGRLKIITGTSDSVMSKHLSALSAAGYLKLSKA
ncbi:MAG: transcriptional regulator, partial [Pseudomonadota bacterium]|nr:transcriptional regulator [Pseudomonadota bacterium]